MLAHEPKPVRFSRLETWAWGWGGLLIFSILFSRIVRVPTGGVPYPLFALSALVPWAYFVHAITTATASITRAAGLVRRAPFPRAVLPLASVVASLIEFAIGSGVLELAYIVLLAFAYERTEMSVVYPVARGLAPVLVLAVSIASVTAFIRGETRLAPALPSANVNSTAGGLPASTVTSSSFLPSVSCHAVNLYWPGGRPVMLKLPSSPVTAK